jgi:hypothetical protein
MVLCLFILFVDNNVDNGFGVISCDVLVMIVDAEFGDELCDDFGKKKVGSYGWY